MLEDQTVSLNSDQQHHLMGRLQMTALATTTLLKALTQSGDEVSVDLIKSVMSNIEFAVRDISKHTGIQSDTADEIQERYVKLRQANERIAALESQLGQRVSGETIKHGLKNLAEKLNAWWDREGFGYIKEMVFNPYGCRLKLSCGLSGAGLGLLGDTPVTDRENYQRWLEELRAKGFTLVKTARSKDPHVLDTPLARELLMGNIASRFPSSRLSGFESAVTDEGSVVLRSLSLSIRDLTEIENMALDQAPSH